jgi:hypothetical protein
VSPGRRWQVVHSHPLDFGSTLPDYYAALLSIFGPISNGDERNCPRRSSADVKEVVKSELDFLNILFFPFEHVVFFVAFSGSQRSRLH